MQLEETGPLVQVPARPGALLVDPPRTAVVVVDMQHDFASPDGMFARAGIPVDGIQAVVEPTRRVLDAARRAGIAVVYLTMQFAEDLSDLGPAAAPNRQRHLALGVGEEIAHRTAAAVASSSGARGTHGSSMSWPPAPTTSSSPSTATAASSRPTSMPSCASVASPR